MHCITCRKPIPQTDTYCSASCASIADTTLRSLTIEHPATPDSYGLPEIDLSLVDDELDIPTLAAAIQVPDCELIARLLYPEFYRPRLRVKP